MEHHKLSVYLCVLRGDLQQQGQGVVVEGIVQGEQRSVDAALVQVAAVLLQPDGLNPADHTLVTPHQHVWTFTESKTTLTQQELFDQSGTTEGTVLVP